MPSNKWANVSGDMLRRSAWRPSDNKGNINDWLKSPIKFDVLSSTQIK